MTDQAIFGALPIDFTDLCLQLFQFGLMCRVHLFRQINVVLRFFAQNHLVDVGTKAFLPHLQNHHLFLWFVRHINFNHHHHHHHHQHHHLHLADRLVLQLNAALKLRDLGAGLIEQVLVVLMIRSC